jgi:hypothetical protein
MHPATRLRKHAREVFLMHHYWIALAYVAMVIGPAAVAVVQQARACRREF